MNHLYEFGPFILDATERVMHKNGCEVRLRQKEYEVLLILIENSGHIVEREAIMQRGWPDSFVEDTNITQTISDLRKKLGEEDNSRQYIETLPKRGYRFIVPVSKIVSTPYLSEDLIPTYSDASPADHNGQYILVLSATIRDIDKPIAEAMEAHLRKLSKDVTLTLMRVEKGSVKLILEGTRAGFERIRELVESGQLSEICGFEIKDLHWGSSSESLWIETRNTAQSDPEDLAHRKDRLAPSQRALALTPKMFDTLLLLLGADTEQASIQYEMIRQKLIKFFEVKGAINPEELADTTLDRVSKSLKKGEKIAPARLDAYFGIIAKQVFQSYRGSYIGKAAAASPKAEAAEDQSDKVKWRCFEKCLLNLSVEERKLILTYYQNNENSKIRERKNLAAQLGITLDSLRIRTWRIRRKLDKCISACMEQSSTDIQEDKQE